MSSRNDAIGALGKGRRNRAVFPMMRYIMTLPPYKYLRQFYKGGGGTIDGDGHRYLVCMSLNVATWEVLSSWNQSFDMSSASRLVACVWCMISGSHVGTHFVLHPENLMMQLLPMMYMWVVFMWKGFTIRFVAAIYLRGMSMVYIGGLLHYPNLA